jgi:hypothetical protein
LKGYDLIRRVHSIDLVEPVAGPAGEPSVTLIVLESDVLVVGGSIFDGVAVSVNTSPQWTRFIETASAKDTSSYANKFS